MLTKFLLLVAMLFMPLGMTTSTAAVAHHSMDAGMPMQHCPDQGSGSQTKGAFAECTMACSAALPAADLPPEERLLVASTPTAPAVTHILRGLHPDTATPPPKLS